MAVSDELVAFVKESLAKGISRAEIEEVLTRTKWQPDDIKSALDRFADVDFQVPVPRPKPNLSAREAFLYLLLFATLYAFTFSLGSLLFSVIDLYNPEPEAADYARQSAIRGIQWGVSWLIVSLPVFLFMTWYTNRDIKQDPIRHSSKTRRWLTYITLFIAATVIIGDLATVLYNLISGGLTVRFVLKVLTVGLIAGIAFIYYLTDLGRDEKEE